jgi:hypothetical protein
MKKIIRRAKEFAEKHDEGIFLALAVAGSLAAAAVTVKITEIATKQQAEFNEWTQEQNFAGKTVIQLADGSHIAVSKEQVS